MASFVSYEEIAKSYKEKYNLINFVETGTETGNGIVTARQIGINPHNMYSCDLRAEVLEEARTRVPEAHLFNTDSLSFLEENLPKIKGNTLFWLDAHFPAHYGLEETPNNRAPMLDEINLIKQLKSSFEKDVIMCDDLHIFVSSENPTYNHGLSEYYKIYYAWHLLADSFKSTHNFEIYCVYQGLGVFVPK